MSTILDGPTSSLNSHGVFLKKAVVDFITRARNIGDFNGLSLLEEDVPVQFGENGSADVVAYNHYGSCRFYFIIECKRVDPSKRWVFFKAAEPNFRFLREVGSNFQRGVYGRSHVERQVCSEGIEVSEVKSEYKASADNIYKAGNQLSLCYLGFVLSRYRALEGSDAASSEFFVPVLVTTADLQVCTFDVNHVSLDDGKIAENAEYLEVPWLMLKHPFSQKQGTGEVDFRDYPSDPADLKWGNMAKHECLYIVRANCLSKFFRQSPWA